MAKKWARSVDASAMVRVTRPMRGLKCSTCDRREPLIAYYIAQRRAARRGATAAQRNETATTNINNRRMLQEETNKTKTQSNKLQSPGIHPELWNTNPQKPRTFIVLRVIRHSEKTQRLLMLAFSAIWTMAVRVIWAAKRLSVLTATRPTGFV